MDRGRVDSPPTSMTSAPSLLICQALATAASASKCLPPSENESGVTFKIPSTLGLERSRDPPFHSKAGGSPA